MVAEQRLRGDAEPIAYRFTRYRLAFGEIDVVAFRRTIVPVDMEDTGLETQPTIEQTMLASDLIAPESIWRIRQRLRGQAPAAVSLRDDEIDQIALVRLPGKLEPRR